MNRLFTSRHLLVLALIGSVLSTGCTEVRPWERGILAKQEMILEPDALESRFYGHIYESKEASSGGYGVGGGGCGCK